MRSYCHFNLNVKDAKRKNVNSNLVDITTHTSSDVHVFPHFTHFIIEFFLNGAYRLNIFGIRTRRRSDLGLVPELLPFLTGC